LTAIRYRNFRFRAVTALIASTYILLHGHSLDVVARAFVTPSFYLALATSYPITLFLVYIVHKLTMKLDERYDWRDNFQERVIWQFLLGILVPALLDIVLISGYSAIVGQSFSQTNFFLVDFPIIVSFIILLNMYYVIRYLLLTEPKPKAEDRDQQHGNHRFSTLTIEFGGDAMQLNAAEDILYFFTEAKLVKVVTRNGIYPIRDSIGELEKQYSGVGFYRINQGTMVNMRIVQGFVSGKAEDTLKIVFFQPHEIRKADEDRFVVTKEYIGNVEGIVEGGFSF
jgi:hypothetical protein